MGVALQADSQGHERAPGGVVARRRLAAWPDAREFLEGVRRLAEEDLWFFVREVVGVGVAEEEPHGALCRWLQRPTPFGRRLVLMPRGSLKTTLVSQAYVLWRIARDPNIRVLLDSEVRANAKSFARVIRSHIEGGVRFRQLWGDLVRQPGWTDDYFTVQRTFETREPTVMTAGMDQTVVSQHYDLIVADDIVNDKTVGTPEMIRKTVEHYRLLLPLLESPQVNPEVELVVVGTRWDDSDLYGYILRESGMETDEAMMVLREAGGEAQIGEWSVFFRGIWREDGSPLCGLYTVDGLERIRRRIGEYHFAAQYLNDPVPVESATFRREWFRYWRPPLPEDLRVVQLVDPAISVRKHGDYSAIVALGFAEDGKRYLLHAWRGRVSPRELIDQIFSVYEEYMPGVVGIEQVSFQAALQILLEEEMARRGIWLPIRPMTPEYGASKEIRIRALQPLYESGQLLHPAREVQGRGQVEELELELLRFPRGQHDDLSDALAYHIYLSGARTKRYRRVEYEPENEVTGY